MTARLRYSARPLLAVVPLLAVLALPGCKREAAPDAGAAGQVLPGSASDAMLPVDRVTSQPPLDPRADRSTGSTGPAARDSATEAAGEKAADAAAPAAEGTGAAE